MYLSARKTFGNMTLEQLKRTALEHIRQAKLKDAFDLLAGHLSLESKAFAELIPLNARESRRFAEEMGGRLDRGGSDVEFSKISTALQELVHALRPEDLGSGGSLADPLDEVARSLKVRFPLTPVFRVNCDRRQPVRTFWRTFRQCAESQRRFQYYFIVGCPTQQPVSFSERVVYELIEHELESNAAALHVRRRASDESIAWDLLETLHSLPACQQRFKRYFAERFGLDRADTTFEDYLRTGLPRLPHQYVTLVFKVPFDQWDEELTPEYLRWMMNTFATESAPDIPMFLFFFVITLERAHLEERLPAERRLVLQQVRELVAQRPGDTTCIEPLPPVPVEDFYGWFELFSDDTLEMKESILELMTRNLKGEELEYLEDKKQLYMERIEQFQDKVYRHHKG